ncbi:hypothetical protein SAMN05216299_11218 [Nitrosospira sp. Nsp14]|nr:hypothetical protein SAMN05216299_11218 [Nitrosospira sp. Nsp14]
MIQTLTIDVSTEIKKVITFYEALAAEQDVRVTCEGDGTVLPAHASDPGKRMWRAYLVSR